MYILQLITVFFLLASGQLSSTKSLVGYDHILRGENLYVFDILMQLLDTPFAVFEFC